MLKLLCDWIMIEWWMKAWKKSEHKSLGSLTWRLQYTMMTTYISIKFLCYDKFNVNLYIKEYLTTLN